MAFDLNELTKQLDFSSLERIEIPFTGPDGKSYVLREANGAAAKQYRNRQAECSVLGPDGRVSGLRNLGELEPLLVSLCVFTDKGMTVNQSVIEKWPGRILTKLYDAAREISELGGEDQTKAALEEALELPGAPVSLQALRDWVNSLEGDQFRVLKALLREEPAKNAPKPTTAGSESPE